MVHSSYEIEKANGWWGPMPAPGRVSVVERRGANQQATFLTIVDGKDAYRVLACMHPEGRFSRDEVQDLRVVQYSPNLAEELFDFDNPNRMSYDHAQVLEQGAFVHEAARLRYAWGLGDLHYLAEGVRHILAGVPLEERTAGEINAYGQYRRRSPLRSDLPEKQYDLLPTSPYAPHGLWTYVPPEHPFDFRVRAECNIQKTFTPTDSLEDLARKAIDVRNLNSPAEVLTSTIHSLFRAMRADNRQNDDS